MAREVFFRRNLPHWYMPHAMHFVTFRLAGTMPKEFLERLRRRRTELLRKPDAGESTIEHRTRVHKLLFLEYDSYLDRNREIHWLDDPRIAALIRRSLYFWHGKKYHLACWSVMPNHVHVLLQPIDIRPREGRERECQECGETADAKSPLSGIMHSLKGYTAHVANKLLGRSGEFWQHESYDHWVRDEDELERSVQYINANSVSARLADRPHQFPWSSAHDRYLYDGETSGWLCFDSIDHASSLVT
jgi:putative transposase